MATRSPNRDVPMWRLALPMTLSNLTVPLVGMVDTAVVGRISVADIGAVAVGATVFSFLFWTFAFVRMGTTGIAAQAHGAGDAEGLAGAAVRAYAMAIVIGCVMVTLAVPVRWLGLLIAGPSEAVAPLASHYIGIRLWSAPATLVNFVCRGLAAGGTAGGARARRAGVHQCPQHGARRLVRNRARLGSGGRGLGVGSGRMDRLPGSVWG